MNSEYWAERFILLEEMRNRSAEDLALYMAQQYRKALLSMNKELAAWYQRYAAANGITLTDAKKLLSASELAEYKMTIAEYIAVASKSGLNDKWKKTLENASARFHVSRLEMLSLALQNTLELLFANQEKALSKGLVSMYEDSYYHTAYEIDKGYGMGATFQGVDENKLKTVMTRPWAADGKNFSQRIWQHRDVLMANLATEMTQAVIRGDDYNGAALKLANRMKVSQGAARRLVMTESAFIASQAQHDCFKSLDVKQYEFIATLDSHTSDICRSMDKKVFKMSEFKPGTTAPPLHCNCRSCTAPYFDDAEDLGRAARDEDGKTNHVSGDTSYEEWKNSVLSDSLDKNDQEYRKIDRGMELGDELSSGEKLKLNRINNAVHDIYISEKANLKPKEFHFIEKTITEAMSVVGNVSNSEKPKIYIVAPNEMNSGARYSAEKNIIYLRSDANTKDKIIGYQQNCARPNNYLSTYTHELIHWKDAMEYRNRYGEISNQSKYLKNIVAKHKKLLDKIDDLEYNKISEYAEKMYLLRRYDEVYTEYRVAKLLGEE